MWIKRDSATHSVYLNTDNGGSFGVDGAGTDWRVQYVHPSFNAGSAFIVQSGYPSREAANSALDEFMDEQGYEKVSPPEVEEEDDTEEV